MCLKVNYDHGYQVRFSLRKIRILEIESTSHMEFFYGYYDSLNGSSSDILVNFSFCVSLKKESLSDLNDE